MVRLILLVIVATGLGACGKKKVINGGVKDLNTLSFPNVDNSVYGAWHNDTTETGTAGYTKDTNIYFNMQGEMGTQVTCAQASEKLVAGLTFPAAITDSSFSIKQDVHMLQKGEGQLKECDLTMKQGSFGLSLKGDHLDLIDGKKRFSFSRIR